MHKEQRLEIVVYGEVQRVGYRYIVQDIARKLGVKGQVENLPDGTVKIVAEASQSTLNRFIEEISIKEPPMYVSKTDRKYSEPTGEFKYFTIKYGEFTEEMAEGFGAGLKYINISRVETKQGFQSLGGQIGEQTQSLRSDMKQEFQNLRRDVKEGFQILGAEFKSMRENMNQNFKEMSTKYDAVSQNLTEAIKMIQEESLKTRQELIRAVDNLAKLVTEFSRRRSVRRTR